LSACAAFDPLDVTPTLGWLQMHEIERERFQFKYRLHATANDAPTHARTAPVLRYGNIWQSVKSLPVPFAADGKTPDILIGVSASYRADGSVV
jgi:hypothetical protein